MVPAGALRAPGEVAVMNDQMNRRGAIRRGAGALGISAVLPSGVVLAAQPAGAVSEGGPWTGFPQQNPAWVRETVGASHRDEKRVRELVGEHPALANAAWDWGFGDWETALGAAAHTGRRAIAEFLIASGARIDIFAAAMLGYVDVVRELVKASPGTQKTRGPHGIHLLAHAKAGGEQAAKVVEYLESLGGAGDPLPTQPLTPDDQKKYIGEFSYGPTETDRLKVLQERDELWVLGADQGKRRLNHIGNHEFFPTGAPGVRLRFGSDASAAGNLSVVDGQFRLDMVRQR